MPEHPSAPTATVADEAARARIATALDRTLFVEAGAGSGKTHALVGRIHALVTTGTCPLSMVAAITFTEKAAAELRTRLRSALTATATGPDGIEADRARRALDELDGAAIGTLHAFARRLLTEHPVEAGLPPRIDVLDEIASQIEFEERWRDQVEVLLDDDRLRADPDLERTLLIGRAAGLQFRHLRQVALAFSRDWDLVAERVPAVAAPLPTIDVGPIVTRLGEIVAQAAQALPGDKLAEHLLTRVAQVAAAIDRAGEVEQIVLLGESVTRNNVGKKTSWPGGSAQVDAIKDELAEVSVWMHDLRDTVLDACLRLLATEIAHFTLAAADARRRAGRLEFHDLLTLARALLRHPEHGAEVRGSLHERYRRLLIDEFQDTDPIQIELAVLLATPPADAPAAWSAMHPSDGRLFFVGDPKQSIYRFRRADIATYLEARDSLGAEVLALTTNFRSTAPLIGWVNHVFGHLVQAVPGQQPEYRPLDAARADTDDIAAGPAVTTFGGVHAGKLKAEDLRRAESRDVAAVVAGALADAWPVRDGSSGWRAPRLGDIAILLPTRASLPMVEDALDALGIAHRAESSALVYASREIRDLLMTVRAVTDPSDELAVVSALRSTVYACSDVELYEHRLAGGRWNYLVPPVAGGVSGPVADALDHLRSLHDAAPWCSPAELLDRIARERRLYELATVTGEHDRTRHRDIWRRLRFVIDQARAWADAGGSALRDYLAWTQRQGEDGARVAEAVLPETDDDAVRIMTVHAAKGLEFPIVVLAGLTTVPRQGAHGPQVSWHHDGFQIHIRAGMATREFEAARLLDEQMDHHERIRLLYVACTRARDHLAVSLHHTVQHATREASKAPSAVLLAGASLTAPHQVPLAPTEPVALVGPSRTAAVAPIDLAAWRAERDLAVTSAGRPTTTAATTLAADVRVGRPPSTATVGPVDGEGGATVDAGLAKEGRDLDLPPWHKGRYGTAIGRAVHAVLQTVDLATGAGLDDAVAAQAAAEGVLGLEPTIAALARAALAAPVVREAAGCPHWRELYVGVPATRAGDAAAGVLEGYVDLLYRGPDGLVVVDHKTDAVTTTGDIDEHMARYRVQGAAYALAVEQATGEQVARCVFVFCTPNGPIEQPVSDLPRAMDEVRARIAAG